MRESDINYALLNAVAFKAALHTILATYQAVLDAWSATRSDKHRQEMKALFHLRLLEGRARRKKAHLIRAPSLLGP